jgi:hypothetical protein
VGTLTGTQPGDADAQDDAVRFRVFAGAWGLAALFHVEFALLVWREPSLVPKVTGVLVAAAGALLVWRPTPSALALLAVVQLIDVITILPTVPNHWLLAGLVNVAVLLAVAAKRRPSASIAAMRAPVMVAVVVFYLWTGVWKLNADFVRPEVSCAAASLGRLSTSFAGIPDSSTLRYAVIGGTLTMELLGPIFLLVPATRGAAVVAFVLFHLLIGLDAVRVYLNFGSVMFALLLLFLPDGSLAGVERLLAARGIRWAAVAYLLLALLAPTFGPGSPVFMLGRWVVWLGYAVALLSVVAVGVMFTPRSRRWLPAGARRSPAWVVPVLVFANGLAPVLGLKTRTSWQMYSNARLERDVSNHFLFGPTLDLLGILREDPVRVVESSSVQFRDVAGTELRLPWLEFRRRVALDPDASITWERAGSVHVTARASDDPSLSAPLPFLVRKLTVFRPIGLDVGARCDW